MEAITLTCPSCGAKLQITNDLDRFACGHCGNEHIVKREGGIVSLRPIVESLKKITVSTDKTALELAINRLNNEIAELESKYIEFFDEMKRAKTMQAGGVFGIIVGVLMFIGGISGNDSVLLFSILVILGGSLFAFSYSANEKQFAKKCDKILEEAKQKKKLLVKHQQIVNN